MKRFFFVIAAPLALSACLGGAAPEEAAAPASPTDAAKAVVTPIMAEQVPGPVGVTLTECLIENSTGDELTQLAAGPSAEVTLLVSNILARQSTVDCATARLSA